MKNILLATTALVAVTTNAQAATNAWSVREVTANDGAQMCVMQTDDGGNHAVYLKVVDQAVNLIYIEIANFLWHLKSNMSYDVNLTGNSDHDTLMMSGGSILPTLNSFAPTIDMSLPHTTLPGRVAKVMNDPKGFTVSFPTRNERGKFADSWQMFGGTGPAMEGFIACSAQLTDRSQSQQPQGEKF